MKKVALAILDFIVGAAVALAVYVLYFAFLIALVMH